MMWMMNGSVMWRVCAIVERITMKNLLVGLILHFLRLGLSSVVVSIVVIVVGVILMKSTGC